MVPPLPKNGRGFLVQLDLKAEVSDVLRLNDEEKSITLCLLHQGESGTMSDEGLVGEPGVWFTDWPDGAQHIDPAVDESSFGRECGVS